MCAQHGPKDGKRKGGRAPRAEGTPPPAGTSRLIAKAASQGKASSGPPRPSRGFLHSGALTAAPVRGALHNRGFAETRVLTEWASVVGDALAPLCRPVKVTYASGGFGATLVVFAEAARAPEVDMMRPKIIERVNAFYGYRAISRVRVTQTAPGARAGGFAEASQGFDRSRAPNRRGYAITSEDTSELNALIAPVGEDELRGALERLGRYVISRSKAADRKD